MLRCWFLFGFKKSITSSLGGHVVSRDEWCMFPIASEGDNSLGRTSKRKRFVLFSTSVSWNPDYFIISMENEDKFEELSLKLQQGEAQPLLTYPTAWNISAKSSRKMTPAVSQKAAILHYHCRSNKPGIGSFFVVRRVWVFFFSFY